MTAKPELILHIGMGKTGTTALQEAFWKNRRVLARAGITYPDIGVVAGAHHKISPLIPTDLAQSGWAFMKPADWAPRLAESGATRILMSSELIAWSTQRGASAFCAALQAHFDLKICLYLRRQDNIIMAAYNQRIKAGLQRRTLGDTLEKLIKEYDYSRTIRIWEQAAGAQSLIVRPYERSQFLQGDLISDFVTGVLGIPMPAGFVQPAKLNSNPHFAPAALEYKRLINCVSEDANASGVYNEPLIAYSQVDDAASSAVFHEQGLLTREQRGQILDHFAASNAEIARKYLGRGTLFSEILSDEVAATPPVRDQDLRDISTWLTAQRPDLSKALVEAAERAGSEKRVVVARAGRALKRSFMSPAQKPARLIQKAAPEEPRRRVIIHPGLPKTGTTAIQEAFFKNRDRLLRDHGLLYPSIDENHTQPILALFRADALKNVRFSGMSQSELEAYRKKTSAQIDAELRRGNWHTLVLSGEGIATLNKEGWEAFLLWLKERGLSSVAVVFGVRDGIDLVRSSIQQNIKSGLLLEDQYAKPPMPGIRARLTPILEVFGRSKIALWDFDEARQSPQGLLHHFCTALQLEPAVCDLIAGTEVFQNESLSQTGVDALAARNRKLGRPRGVNAVEHAGFLSMKGSKFVLPPEVTAKVAKAAEMDKLWLDRVFRGMGASGSRPVSPLGSSAPLPRRGARNPGELPAMTASALSGRATDLDTHGEAKPDLILHVGMDKTGTTAIQHALEQAHEQLKSNFRLLVPRTGLWSDYSHHPFAFASLGTNGFSTSELDGLFDQLENEVSKSGCKTVLITSECLFKLPIKPGINLFWPKLQQIFGTVRVVIYVRRQDKWIESRFRHSVISGQEIPVAQLSGPRFADYLPYIDGWAEVVGAANVQVRAYESGQFPNGDIAADFEQAAGLPAGVLPGLSDSRANVAFSYEAVLLRAAFNHLKLPQFFYSGLNGLLAEAVAGGPPDRPFVTSQLARKLVDRYAGSNRQIALKYMGRADGRLFFDPVPEPSETDPTADINRSRMATILDAIGKKNPELLWSAGKAAGALSAAESPNSGAPALVRDLVAVLRDIGFVHPQSGRAPRPNLASLAEGLMTWLKDTPFRVLLLRRKLSLAITWLGRKYSRNPILRRARPGPSQDGKAEQILVHFGILKTGSTSIQTTLHEQARILSNCAYLDAGLPNHSLIVSMAIQDAEVVRGKRGTTGTTARLRLKKQLAIALLSEKLATAMAASSRIVISAEVVSSFTSDEAARLHAFLTPYAQKIRFLGYIRDPVTLMQSVFQERLKHNRSGDVNFESLMKHGPPKLYRIVDRLDALFGRESVSVYPFDPAIFPEGDVVRHFLDAADIRGDGLTTIRANDRLSITAVKALFCYRKLCGSRDPAGFEPTRADFVADLRMVQGPAFSLHPEVQEQIKAASTDWDEWAERRLGRPLAYLARKVETGVRSEADLMKFSDEELSEIARYGERHGISTISSRSSAEDVAQMVKKIRFGFAGAVVK